MALCELSFPSAGSSPPDFSVRSFVVHEALSTLFEAAVVAVSPSAVIDFEGLVGQPARFSIHGGDLGQRFWEGVVLGMELCDIEEEGLSTYRLTVVPRAWLMTQRTNHRVFQHQSAPEIAAELLGAWGVDLELRLDRSRFPKLEYRVQYGETDFAFLSRILEAAGIHFFFEPSGETNRMILCDAPEAQKPEGPPLPYVDHPSPASRAAYVTNLAMSTEVRPGKTVLRDYDFRRPDFALAYKFEAPGSGEENLEVYRYTPGLGRIEVQTKPTDTPAADNRSAARIDEHEGYAAAARALSGARVDRRHVSFNSNDLRLAPGKALSIRNHPKAALQPDRRMIIQSVEISGTIDDEWEVEAGALFADLQIRPIPKTPKPTVPGPQSAIVVGPKGEEIHTDEFGRVRVRFPWDRGGEFDDQRTCWLRVADGWAGAGFGMIAIPRVGHEVIVDFFEGNPDEPLIVGRLYGTTQPPPYALPSKRTKSGWKSRSTPDSEGYNEISFDDALEHEMVSIRAEKDLTKIVVNEERETTQRDRTLIIGQSFAQNVKENDTLVVGGVHSVQMGKFEKAEVVAEGGQPDVVLGETLREMIPGRITISTGGATIQLDGPDIVITAESDVFFKAGKDLKIQGGPYVQINPPVIGKSADKQKTAPEPAEVVWFKLTSDDGSPLPDVVCHVEHENGEVSSVQRTDGYGMVRFPAVQSGDYKLVVGAPSPKVKAKKPEPKGIEVGKTPSQKTTRAKPSNIAVPIAIEVVSPLPNSVFEIDPGKHPGPDPSMPVLSLHANVTFQGKSVTQGTLTWEFSVSGKYRVRDKSQKGGYRQQEYKLVAGSVQTSPGQKLEYRLEPNEIVGGELSIKVTYQSGPDLGDLKAAAIVKGGKIIGKNPGRENVLALVEEIGGTQTWLFVRMFCHESAHIMGNFRESGEVLYGPPAGVGIVQRDPEKNEWKWPKSKISQPNNFFPRIFWDWKKNVREGVERFRSDYMERARKEIDALRQRHPNLPEASEEILIRSAIRHYNGGNEYQASKDGRHYVVAPYQRRGDGGTLISLKSDRLPYVNQVLDEKHADKAKYPVPADVRAQIWPAK